MIKEQIKQNLTRALEELGYPSDQVDITSQENQDLGDYSSSVAFKLAREVKQSPVETANEIVAKMVENSYFNVEVAGNGFLNFRVSNDHFYQELKEILTQQSSYGHSKPTGKKVVVEFISANPTGPLTLGNGRGGFMGDTLANVLLAAGHKVEREYYVNDGGNQIDNILANSVRAALGYSADVPEGTDLYSGDYIKEVAEKVEYVLGDLDNKPNREVGEKAVEIILTELIKPTIEEMKVKFDKFAFESKISTKASLDKVMEKLVKKELVYEEEGAVWFKASKLGHFKNQVLVTSQGYPTYFFKDFAYYVDKFEKRGFDTSVIFLGADHHGLVEGHMAACRALGYEDRARIVLFQLVKLVKDGQELRMSKRKGDYVTMNFLLDIVGIEAARFFFINTAPNTHMDFDVDLATEKSDKNPVYYVQYAHARMSSILTKAGFELPDEVDLSLLKREAELALVKHLVNFPELIQKVAESYDVSEITRYLIKLADKFHHYYEDVRIISDEKALSTARLALVEASRSVMRGGLDLTGVSHPDRM